MCKYQSALASPTSERVDILTLLDEWEMEFRNEHSSDTRAAVEILYRIERGSRDQSVRKN